MQDSMHHKETKLWILIEVWSLIEVSLKKIFTTFISFPMDQDKESKDQLDSTSFMQIKKLMQKHFTSSLTDFVTVTSTTAHPSKFHHLWLMLID